MLTFKVVVACGFMGDGPGLMPVTVLCSKEEYDNGDHYEKAKEQARINDYDEPFVAIDEHDSPKLMEMFDWKKAERA